MKTTMREAFEAMQVPVVALSNPKSLARRVLHIANRQDELKVKAQSERKGAKRK